MNILAIDQASKTGICYGEGLWDEWDFTKRKDESQGFRWLRFEAKLKELHSLLPLDVVVYERVAGFHKASLIHSAKMVAIIERFCDINGIEYRAFSATEIKKFATGKGNANKAQMVKAAQEKYGFEGTSDNVADAIHLYYLTKSTI